MKKIFWCIPVFVFFMMVGTASAAVSIKIYRMSDPASAETYSADAAGTLESGVTYGIANNTPLNLYLCDNTGCYKDVPPWNNTSVTREEDTPFELHWGTDHIEIHLMVTTPETATPETPTLETPTPETPTPETPTPETPTPETPTPETPTPETPIPETPTLITPTPETPTTEPETPLTDLTPEPVSICPEDETGLYSLNENGEKVYNWFYEYSTCMFYMGDKDFCSRFPIQ